MNMPPPKPHQLMRPWRLTSNKKALGNAPLPLISPPFVRPSLPDSPFDFIDVSLTGCIDLLVRVPCVALGFGNPTFLVPFYSPLLCLPELSLYFFNKKIVAISHHIRDSRRVGLL